MPETRVLCYIQGALNSLPFLEFRGGKRTYTFRREPGFKELKFDRRQVMPSKRLGNENPLLTLDEWDAIQEDILKNKRGIYTLGVKHITIPDVVEEDPAPASFFVPLMRTAPVVEPTPVVTQDTPLTRAEVYDKLSGLSELKPEFPTQNPEVPTPVEESAEEEKEEEEEKPPKTPKRKRASQGDKA